jgi:hypothetical protein
MNVKRFLMALVAVFLGAYVLGFLIHFKLLAQDYVFIPSLLRDPSTIIMPYFWLGYLGFALGFVWLYTKALDTTKTWFREGLRFGACVWLMASACPWLVALALQPIGRRLAARGMASEFFGYLLLGALAAGIYRKEKAPAAKSAAA